jgi:soluble cytochrome b562
VIFLPLSFASSIFSMAGSPSHSTVVSFMIAATVALVVTIVFVLNAGVSMRIIVRHRNKMFKLPQDGFVMEHADTSWRAVPRTLDEWLVKYPAERVLAAREILEEKRSKSEEKDDGSKRDLVRRKSNPDDEERKRCRAELKRKQKRRKDYYNISLGIVLFPVFAFIYALRFIFANTCDLLKALFYILPQYPTKRHELVEDDEKSIASESASSQSHFGKRSARKDKGKEGEANETVESKKQRKRRDLKNREARYREYRLGLFMALPRIDHIAKHLAKGNTIKEAIAARKEDIDERRDELEKLKIAYLDSLKKLDERDAEKKEPGIKREGSNLKSGDDGAATRVRSEDYMSHDDASQPRGMEPPSFWSTISRSLGLGVDTQDPSDVEARGTGLRRSAT